MAYDFSTARVRLNELDQIIARARVQLRQAKTLATQQDTTLGAIPTNDAELITFINDQAAANPDNAAWSQLKADLDASSAAFTALKTESSSMVTALAPFDL